MSTGSYIPPSHTFSPAPNAFSEALTVSELGVDRGLLLDIVIKTLFYQGRMTRLEISDAMKISSSATQELMALHIDMRVRRVASFPDDRRAVLDSAVAEFTPAELPKGAGRRIAMPK